MRFMMMVIPEGYESAAPDAVPRTPKASDSTVVDQSQSVER